MVQGRVPNAVLIGHKGKFDTENSLAKRCAIEALTTQTKVGPHPNFFRRRTPFLPEKVDAKQFMPCCGAAGRAVLRQIKGLLREMQRVRSHKNDC